MTALNMFNPPGCLRFSTAAVRSRVARWKFQ